MLHPDRDGSDKGVVSDDESRNELHRFAVALVSNHAEAKHLVDEAYMRLTPSEPRRLDETRQLKQILHEIVIQRQRDFPTEVVWEEVETKWELDEYTVKLQPIVESLAEPDELHNVLSRLPFIYRSVLVLFQVEGWTEREIASAQELSVRRVEERIRRARMMVVTALARGAERSMVFRQTGRNCYRIRQKFSPYLDGLLSRKDRYSIDRHLRHCPTCPPLYAALVAVRDALAPTNPSVL
jgi:RNA polymerase sigma-70 factor (ECF subfamily)